MKSNLFENWLRDFGNTNKKCWRLEASFKQDRSDDVDIFQFPSLILILLSETTGHWMVFSVFPGCCVMLYPRVRILRPYTKRLRRNRKNVQHLSRPIFHFTFLKKCEIVKKSRCGRVTHNNSPSVRLAAGLITRDRKKNCEANSFYRCAAAAYVWATKRNCAIEKWTKSESTF